MLAKPGQVPRPGEVVPPRYRPILEKAQKADELAVIPEGANKRVLCSTKRIDPDDYFGLLLEVAGDDTVGAVKVVRNV